MKIKWIIAIIPFLILLLFIKIGPNSFISMKMILLNSILAISIGFLLTFTLAIVTYRKFNYIKRVFLLLPFGIFLGFLYPCYSEIKMYFEVKELDKMIIKDFIFQTDIENSETIKKFD